MTDNLFGNSCPGIMQDNRFFTNYNDKMAITQDIRQKYNLNTVHEFRYFLQKNGLQILEKPQNTCLPKVKCSYNDNHKYSKVMPMYTKKI